MPPRPPSLPPLASATDLREVRPPPAGPFVRHRDAGRRPAQGGGGFTPGRVAGSPSLLSSSGVGFRRRHNGSGFCCAVTMLTLSREAQAEWLRTSGHNRASSRPLLGRPGSVAYPLAGEPSIKVRTSASGPLRPTSRRRAAPGTGARGVHARRRHQIPLSSFWSDVGFRRRPNGFGLNCASNMPPPGREVQAEWPGS